MLILGLVLYYARDKEISDIESWHWGTQSNMQTDLQTFLQQGFYKVDEGIISAQGVMEGSMDEVSVSFGGQEGRGHPT